MTRNELKQLIKEVIQEADISTKSKYLNDETLNRYSYGWAEIPNNKKSINGIIQYAMTQYKANTIEELDKRIKEFVDKSYNTYGQQDIGFNQTVDLGVEPFLKGTLSDIVSAYKKTIK